MNFKEMLDDFLKNGNLNTEETIVEEFKPVTKSDELNEEETVIKDNAYYFNMTDPETGLKYDIPMLDSQDPEYFFKYVYYMKLKENAPETFAKILGWD